MTLGGGEALQAVLLDEGSHLLLLDLALLHAQGADHLEVGQRHVTSATRLGDVGVLHLGRELVYVHDGKAGGLQRIVDEGADDLLRSGAGAHGDAAQVLQVDDGANAVVLSDDEAKAADHVLERGQALLDVLLAVHAKLGGAATGGDGNGLVGTRGNQGGSLDEGVGGGGAEATGVGAGGVHKAGDLSSGLGEVATTALVHVAAGLLGAIDDVIDVLLLDAGVLDAVEQREDGGRLLDDVLVHDFSGEVMVHIVGAADATHELVVNVKTLRGLLGNEALDLGVIRRRGDTGDDGLVNQRVGSELILGGLDELAINLDEVEDVAGSHEEGELVLGHNLAELAVAVAAAAILVIPRERELVQILGHLVANVNLIGQVVQSLVIGAQVVRQLLQVIAARVDDALGSLSGAVPDDHIGRVRQNKAGTLDDALHFLQSPFPVSVLRPHAGKNAKYEKGGVSTHVGTPPQEVLLVEVLAVVVADSRHLVTNVVEIENHLHHGDLVIVDVLRNLCLNLRLADVVNRESQLDPSQRTCEGRVAIGDGLSRQTSALAVSGTKDNGNVLSAILLCELLDTLLVLQVHCTCSRSNEALGRREDHFATGRFGTSLDGITGDTITVTDSDDLLSLKNAHANSLLILVPSKSLATRPHAGGHNTKKTLEVLLDHCLNVLGRGVVLDALVHLLAVLINGDDGEAENLLADGQTTSLGGVQRAELDLIAVLVSKAVDVRHEGSARNAAVAEEVNQDGALSLKDLGLKRLLINLEHGHDGTPFLLSYFKLSM